MTSDQTKYDLLVIGNAIIDILAQVDEKFVDAQASRGMEKGAMALIDGDRAEELFRDIEDNATMVSGGSGANTLSCFTTLGGSGAYIGKVADDNLGDAFTSGMKKTGIHFETPALENGPATAQCIILVTPDAERTMNTYLGACVTLGPDDIDENLVKNSQVTYLEGYLFDPPHAKEAFYKAAKIVREADNKLALTLSDPFCVKRHRQDFKDLIENSVDILFANEEEICALYECEFEDAIEAIKGKCDIVAVTRSAKGSVILSGDEKIEVSAVKPACLIDTTGAGDAYAAGFLYGYTQGYDLKTCATMGSAAASEIIAAIGPRPQDNFVERVKGVTLAA